MIRVALSRRAYRAIEAHPRTFGECSAEAGAGAMLVACRVAGLSALDGDFGLHRREAQLRA
jgi:hypothetical protein